MLNDGSIGRILDPISTTKITIPCCLIRPKLGTACRWNWCWPRPNPGGPSIITRVSKGRERSLAGIRDGVTEETWRGSKCKKGSTHRFWLWRCRKEFTSQAMQAASGSWDEPNKDRRTSVLQCTQLNSAHSPNELGVDSSPKQRTQPHSCLCFSLWQSKQAALLVDSWPTERWAQGCYFKPQSLEEFVTAA